jgi:hypothetical protein
VLVLQLAQVEELLLERGLLVVVVRKDGAERARYKREGCDTCEHDNDAENALDRRWGGQITVAHCRCRSHNEVERHDVELVVIHAVVIGVPHPRIHVLIEGRNENEHAGWDVEKEDEEEDEEHQTLFSTVNTQFCTKVWHNTSVILQ